MSYISCSLTNRINWAISRYLAKINVLNAKKTKKNQKPKKNQTKKQPKKGKVLKKLLTNAVKIKSRQKPNEKGHQAYRT